MCERAMTVSKADEILGGPLVFGDPTQLEAIALQEAAEKLRRLWRKHPHLVPSADRDPSALVKANRILRGQTMVEVQLALGLLDEIVNFSERVDW